MKKPCFPLAVIAFLVLPLGLAAQTPSLAIQVDHPTAKVSPMLYGLMTEEINYSYDGGIYGELVRDRVLDRGFGGLVALDDGSPRKLRGRMYRWTNRRAPAPRCPAVSKSAWNRPLKPRRPELRTTAIGESRCGRTRRIADPFMRRSDSAWRSGDGEPGERSDRRHGGFGNRDGIDRRVEAVQLHAQDRRRAGHRKQSSDPDHFAAGNGLVRSGLALSAHLSWPAERQPHRHHGEAGGDASQVSAPAGRKLS